MKKKIFLPVAMVGAVAVIAFFFHFFNHNPHEGMPKTSSGISVVSEIPRAPTSVKWRASKPQVPRVAPRPNPNLVIPPSLSERFKETLSYKPSQSSEIWSYGKVGNLNALRDMKTGLVWGPRLKVTLNRINVPEIVKAMQLCAALDPAGGWALPTTTEFDDARRDGLLKIDRDAQLSLRHFLLVV